MVALLVTSDLVFRQTVSLEAKASVMFSPRHEDGLRETRLDFDLKAGTDNSVYQLESFIQLESKITIDRNLYIIIGDDNT